MANTAKTRYIMEDGTERGRTNLGSSVTINEEVAEEFVYLGFLVLYRPRDMNHARRETASTRNFRASRA